MRTLSTVVWYSLGEHLDCIRIIDFILFVCLYICIFMIPRYSYNIFFSQTICEYMNFIINTTLRLKPPLKIRGIWAKFSQICQNLWDLSQILHIFQLMKRCRGVNHKHPSTESGIWNLALKHHRKIWNLSLSQIPLSAEGCFCYNHHDHHDESPFLIMTSPPSSQSIELINIRGDPVTGVVFKPVLFAAEVRMRHCSRKCKFSQDFVGYSWFLDFCFGHQNCHFWAITICKNLLHS